MTQGRRSLLTAIALLAWTATAVADALTDLVARVKPSVVLVGSYGLMDSPRFGFRGTGFAVADGLHVLTNAHVIPPEIAGRIDRGIAVQVWTPQAQWTLRSAKLISTDVRHDLALLKIDAPALPALRLAASEAREGTSIALIGFPLGGLLGYAHVTHRGIVSARTAIAPPAIGAQNLNERALKQLREGSFEILQMDATAYPGNSGGPVFDIETGDIVGVVNMGLVKGTKESAISSPTGITYAIPAREAAALLARQPAP